MNLGQLVDPEWAQAGYRQRFVPAVRPELVEAQRQAERERRAQAEADARREHEERQRTAELLARRRAESEAARQRQREEAAARAAEERRREQAARVARTAAPAPKGNGKRPVMQLAILGLLVRSTVRLGVGAIARGAKLDPNDVAANLVHMRALGLVERSGERCHYRYAPAKAGREKLARYALYS